MIYCLGSSVSNVHLKMHSVKLFLYTDVKNKWIGSRVGTFDSCLKTDQPSLRIRKSKFLRLSCFTGGCCFVGVCLTCSQMSLFFHLASTKYSSVSKITSWFNGHMLSACLLDKNCCSADKVKLPSPMNWSCPQPANAKLSAPRDRQCCAVGFGFLFYGSIQACCLETGEWHKL